MISSNEKYWFLIKSNTYIDIKDNCALLYNTENSKYIETDSSACLLLLEKLNSKDKLGVIDLDDEYFSNRELKSFINDAIEKNIASLIRIDENTLMPIVFRPILNLQNDIDKLNKENHEFIGDNVIKYLNQLNIHVTNYCDIGCLNCGNYNKQLVCCNCDNKTKVELDLTAIDKLLLGTNMSVTKKINILGGDISSYNNWNGLKKILSKYDYKYTLYLNYLHVKDVGFVEQFSNNFEFEVIINPNFKQEELVHSITNLLKTDKKIRYNFIIENEIQYELAEDLTKKWGIDSNITPFFNQNNHSFFDEYIAISKEDILSEQPIKFNSIFKNMKLNTNFFGILNIFPEGEVYANVNKPSIGNIYNNSLLNIVLKEITTTRSWRNTRTCEPCSKCLYQWLCPSPSNYELVIGKPNLCHIKP